MIKKLYLENFRSLVKDELELGKITVLTGPNNSGKSTIIYGLLALKNFLLMSNQSLDNCLNLGFINLGGFRQVVHLKDELRNIQLGIDVVTEKLISHYSLSFGERKSELSLVTSKPIEVRLNLEVSFPYAMNKNIEIERVGDFGKAEIDWNGITHTIRFRRNPSMSLEEEEDFSRDLFDSIGLPIEELRRVDFIPLRRGFLQPTYSPVSMQPQLMSEAELATLLAINRDLENKVAFYLEKIVPRVFRVRQELGTAIFNLQTSDKENDLVCDLVNEGFGTNQLVAILTKSLQKDKQTICIEETEIHLHPEAISKLVDVFVEIAKQEGKNFIISTHSEHIVVSLLNKIAQKKLAPSDVKIYYLSKDQRKTVVEKQVINEKGQIQGGLKGFYETELKGIKDFFNVTGE
jgi:predicted ATPase